MGASGPMSIDLHIHSTMSDGTLTPEEIVREACQKGLSVIAISDHDTIAGVRAALRAAEGTGLTVIPAVEISTDYKRVEVHILGYYIDLDDATLAEKLSYVRDARLLRAEKIVQKLRGLGVAVTLDEVLAESDGQSLGRPHVAAALVRKGVCGHPQEAFDRFLKRGRPAYVPRYKLTPMEAMRAIEEAGGCHVLAHPGLGVPDALIHELAQAGLHGIEAYHTRHTPSQTRRAHRLADELGLLITGGTDSHGPGGSYPVEIGSVAVPDSCAEALAAWAHEHDAPVPT